MRLQGLKRASKFCIRRLGSLLGPQQGVDLVCSQSCCWAAVRLLQPQPPLPMPPFGWRQQRASGERHLTAFGVSAFAAACFLIFPTCT